MEFNKDFTLYCRPLISLWVFLRCIPWNIDILVLCCVASMNWYDWSHVIHPYFSNITLLVYRMLTQCQMCEVTPTNVGRIDRTKPQHSGNHCHTYWDIFHMPTTLYLHVDSKWAILSQIPKHLFDAGMKDDRQFRKTYNVRNNPRYTTHSWISLVCLWTLGRNDISRSDCRWHLQVAQLEVIHFENELYLLFSTLTRNITARQGYWSLCIYIYDIYTCICNAFT